MTTVAEIDPARQPFEVIGACVVVGVSFLVGCIVDLFFQADHKPHFYGAAVLAVVGVLVVRGLWRGVGWLRSLLVAMTAIGLVASVVMIIMRQNFAYPAWFGVQAVLQCAAAVLLLRPASRAWFASR